MRGTLSACVPLTASFRLLRLLAALALLPGLVCGCGVKPRSHAPSVSSGESAAARQPAGSPSAEKPGADDAEADSPPPGTAVVSPPKKKPSFAMPRFVDDRYGTGALGPRILFHESEVVDVAPQRMEVYLRADSGQDGTLLTDAEARAAAEADSKSGERPQTLTAASDSDGRAGQDTESSPAIRAAAGRAPREGEAGARPARPVRVWEAREPRPARDASPLSPALVDTRAYLASLGIHSVYDLSPGSRRLALPPEQRFGASPLLGSGAPLRAGATATFTPRQWEGMIQEAGRLFGLDPQFIAAIIKVESNFDHLAVSSKGAQGAMQIMPGTQAQLGLKDPFDVQANIHAGCAFIRELLLQYGSTELALAAYNAGPGAVDKYGGIPPYAETQNYVRRVMALWQREETQPSPVADGRGAQSGTNRALQGEEKKVRRSHHASRKKRSDNARNKGRKPSS